MPASPLQFQAHPDVWLLMVALLGGYFYALAALGPRLAPGRRPATSRQKLYFTLGVAALWLGAEWPVHDLAENYLYSVHMAQHLTFQLVAPPLLILGTPGWLLRALLRPKPVFAVARVLTRGLPAVITVSAFIALTHTPVWVEATVSNGLVHLLAHVLLVGMSLLMWWPVLSPLPELPHLSYPGRMVYLFAHSIIPTVPASFLTFTSRPLYASYAEAPRLWAWLDPVQDQQIAGLLMKIGGGLVIWGVIAVLFFRWQAEEESGGPDLLYWRDLEPTLPTSELTAR
ncbi:MAG: cytochrome c oxidase assembly protein [Euzebyaceae bacterium]|nr:cytochrome c oxidase assembly protein [Euzebyaceae bacterium]